MVTDFIKALNNDLFPSEEIEGVFGIRMSDNKSKVDSNLGLSYPLGNLVFYGWTTIKIAE